MPKTAKPAKSSKSAKPVAPAPLPEIDHGPLVLTEHNPSRQQHVDLAELVVPPWGNPRAPITPESVAGLARTIDRFGMLQPIVVSPVPDPGPGFYLLAGHRRVAAARLLGLKTVPARILVPARGEVLDQIAQGRLASVVAMVENGQRADLDPLRDCEVVESLLAEDGTNVSSVAAELGVSPAWVARRARLTHLCDGVRSSIRGGGPIAQWPVAWLEDLALLGPDDQARLIEMQTDGYQTSIKTRGALRALVRQRLQTLGSAPWDLDDATSWTTITPPGTPSCAACTKHTGAQPGLFEETDTAALKDARCLDGACWARKLACWRSQQIETAKEKHGDAVVLIEGRDVFHRGSQDPEEWEGHELARDLDLEKDRAKGDSPPEEGGPRRFREYELEKAKKGEKGAVPALVISGAGAGTTRWVKLPPETKNGRPARGEKPKPKTLAQKRAQLAERRQRALVLLWRDRVEKWRVGKEWTEEIIQIGTEAESLLDLIGAWGASLSPNIAGISGGKDRLVALGARGDLRRRVIEGIFDRWWLVLFHGCQIKTAEPYYSEVEVMAQATRQVKLLDVLKAQVVVDIPEPKGWAPATAPAKVKTPAPKSKKKAGRG